MTMDPKIDRWYRKANAFVVAWQRRYGETPAKHTVVLGLLVMT
jgi:hypothetical protein